MKYLPTLSIAAALLTTLVSFHAQATRVIGVDFDKELVKAVEHFQVGEFSKAIEKLKPLVKLYPSREEAPLFMGICQFNLDEFSEARTWFEKVISMNGSQVDAAKQFMVRLGLKTQEYALATQNLKSLIIDAKKNKALKSEIEQLKADTISALDQCADRAFTNSEYRKAIECADHALSIEENVDFHIVKAVNFMRLGEPNAAQEEFLIVQRLSPQGQYKEDVERYLDQIKKGSYEGSKNYWLSLHSVVGANSNPTGEGDSEIKSSRITSRTALNLGNHFLAEKSTSFILDYQLYWEEFWGQAPIRTVSNALHGAIYIDHRSWSVKLLGGLNHQMQGGSSLMWLPELNVRTQLSFNRFEVGLEYYRAWKNIIDDEYSYLGGAFEQRHVFLGYDAPTWNLGFYAFDIRDAIGDLTFTNGARLPLASTTRGPGVRLILKPRPEWEIDAGLTYFFKDYFNSSLPSGTLRDDKETSATLRVSRKLKEELTLTTLVEVLWNSSTLDANEIDDKNFFRFAMLGGLKWEILP
jgi:tetratricopeptide (TPR) repeat protein